MLNQSAALDRVFHALADPTRRAILERLTRGPASVSELAAPMAMSFAAVTQHLAVLEASRLLHSSKQGRVRTCTLDAAALARAEGWLRARRANWEEKLDRLGKVLVEESQPSPRSGRSKP